MDGTDEGWSGADAHQGNPGRVTAAHAQTKSETSMRASNQGIVFPSVSTLAVTKFRDKYETSFLDAGGLH